jgi:UDP-N-acetylglucosamine 2-epimerase (non-hydrolysing)
MTIVGTRPELIKMSRVIAEVERHCRHVLVHTGQNFDYELNQVFFEDLGIRKPDEFLEAAGGTAAQTIAQVIARSDIVIEREQPDALLLYGDTNSCLSIIPAKRRKIPVFHMEAGNRCFDQRVPEELNRKILDHLADVNLVITEHARRYLIAEGIRPEVIFKTGSHLYEVLEHYGPRIEESDILTRLGLRPKEYFLVSAHREENVDVPESLSDLVASFEALAETYDVPVIVSTHPRTRQQLQARELKVTHPNVQLHKPFGYFDYMHLQTRALCVLSDSGTITEEASILNFPAITIRNAHERPEGMDVGTLIMSGVRPERVLEAVRIMLAQHENGGRAVLPVADYVNPHVSTQVVRVLVSYVDYVNRTVWFR